MKRGFTLLETVIAMGLAVVLLGASISARRFAIQSGQLAESRTMMTSLVSQSIENMELLHLEYPNNWSAPGMFNLPTSSSAQNVIVYNDGVSAAGNQKISFCLLTNPITHCSPNTLLPVAASPSANQVSYITNPVNSAVLAEIVAVKQSSIAGGLNVVDAATLPASAFPPSYPITPTTGGYTLYYRQVTVTREVDSSGATTTTPYAYYMVTVQVWPYGQNAGSGVTRSTFVADQPAGINPL